MSTYVQSSHKNSISLQNISYAWYFFVSDYEEHFNFEYSVVFHWKQVSMQGHREKY